MAEGMWVDPLLARPRPPVAIDIDALFRLHRVRLTRLAAAITLDRSLAEEVVQDAFAGLQRRRSDIANPEAYLQRSVVNLGIKLLRRRAVAGRHGDQSSTLATLSLMTAPPEMVVDVVGAQARLYELFGSEVSQFLPPEPRVTAANLGEPMLLVVAGGDTAWASIVTDSGVLFRVLLNVGQVTSSPLDAMREMADFVSTPS